MITMESAAYHFAILPLNHQTALKNIILSFESHDMRMIEIRKYCNQNLFDYVSRGLIPRTLTTYLERLYL